jgi:hypothetical protein
LASSREKSSEMVLSSPTRPCSMNFGCNFLRCANFSCDYLPPHSVSVWIISHHNQFQWRFSSTVTNFNRNWLRMLLIASSILRNRLRLTLRALLPSFLPC